MFGLQVRPMCLRIIEGTHPEDWQYFWRISFIPKKSDCIRLYINISVCVYICVYTIYTHTYTLKGNVGEFAHADDGWSLANRLICILWQFFMGFHVSQPVDGSWSTDPGKIYWFLDRTVSHHAESYRLLAKNQLHRGSSIHAAPTFLASSSKRSLSVSLVHQTWKVDTWTWW